MNRPLILLQPLGTVDVNLLKYLKEGIEERLDVRVILSAMKMDVPEDAYVKSRRQYVSEKIIMYLRDKTIKLNYDRVLGVADVDAFSPGLNFVFGQAWRSYAVIYLPRLRQEFYKMKPNPELFKLRALKEALHELGHTFGLMHCPNSYCVMHFSNSIVDTDMKKAEYCFNCRFKLAVTGIRVKT